MLRLAAFAEDRSIEALKESPELARYVNGWGRAGDLGLIAVDERSKPVGAAWIRIWLGPEKGYGYIDDDTPELSIAVLPAHRGRGIGTKLVTELLAAAAGENQAVSLSVLVDNAALNLYRRIGFEVIDRTEINPGSPAVTMRVALATYR